jgi:protein-tyrosine phosphatase
MVIAYLIKYQKMSFDEALKMCREKRDIVWPNIWFVKQLRVWEEKVLASEEVKIKEN